MKIKMTLKVSVITATLANSKSVWDFVSLLPPTLTLEDYARTEKNQRVTQKIIYGGRAARQRSCCGRYYILRSLGNLAIFYKDFGYASGLAILGKIDDGIEALSVPDSANVTIELVEEERI